MRRRPGTKPLQPDDLMAGDPARSACKIASLDCRGPRRSRPAQARLRAIAVDLDRSTRACLVPDASSCIRRVVPCPAPTQMTYAARLTLSRCPDRPWSHLRAGWLPAACAALQPLTWCSRQLCEASGKACPSMPSSLGLALPRQASGPSRSGVPSRNAAPHSSARPSGIRVASRSVHVFVRTQLVAYGEMAFEHLLLLAAHQADEVIPAERSAYRNCGLWRCGCGLRSITDLRQTASHQSDDDFELGGRHSIGRDVRGNDLRSQFENFASVQGLAHCVFQSTKSSALW